MFVLVSRRSIYHPVNGFAELRGFFGKDQTIVSDVIVTPHYGQFVIVEAPDAGLAQDLCNRLHTDMFGTTLFSTKAEAEVELKHWNDIR